MKKLIFLLISGCFFIQCKKNDSVEIVDVKKSVDLNIERFDKEFLNVDEQKLVALKKKYPMFLPEREEFTSEFWIAKSKEPAFIELNNDVQKKFKDVTKLENDIEILVSRIQHYFPEEKTPRVFTVINEITIDKKAFYTNNEIIIALDSYLGKDYKYYGEFSEYQKANLEPNQILPDLVTNFAYRKILPSQDKTLISEMIYFGKLHYLKDLLIPDVPNYQKIGYSDIKYRWCEENEAQIWAYFIEEKLLFESNIKNNQRFIEDGPFTNFGRPEIDRESPGRVGQWLGWQIVKSYMENNDVTLDQMLKTEPIVIFNSSKYKPKK